MARHFGVPPNNGRPRDNDRRLRAVNTEAPLDGAGDCWLDDDSLVDRDRDANHGFRRLVVGVTFAFAFVSVILIALICAVFARDPGGRYANSPLKAWFDQLASGKGLCCSFADGLTVEDVDWDTRNGHYRVRLDEQWIDVPDAAVVTEPNRFGPAVVWPYQDANGVTQIRCFLPGAGA